MKPRTLFLAWQDSRTRRWFPVGRLDVDLSKPLYVFRYIRGAKEAEEQAGFEPLFDFPEFTEQYQSRELFPFFQNRVIAPGRPDFSEYLRQLNLPAYADPIDVLSVGGGTRATDAFEIFPKLELKLDGSFSCRFFLHGWRYTSEHSQKRLDQLQPGEDLRIAFEVNNPATRFALQIQTADYYILGWTPHYLVWDFLQILMNASSKCCAKVVQVNPVPAPSRQRLLIELLGTCTGCKLMETLGFEPLVD